jgi:RNA polymerase sigma-70 factor (ECF subfamily)
LVNDQLPDGALALDGGALASIFTSYYPRIYNYAFLQLGDIQAAEDLASEVMLKVLESVGRYRPTGAPFSAWVFRIARNRLIDLYRQRKRRGEVDLRQPPADTRMDPDTLAEMALDRGQLQIALKYLTESQRQVIVLRFIEGFDNASVARILGRSEGAVKSLQHRALNSLRSIMSEEAG